MDRESSRGREGKGKKDSGGRCLRDRHYPLFSSRLPRGLSVWRGSPAWSQMVTGGDLVLTITYRVVALLLCLALLPHSSGTSRTRLHLQGQGKD